MKNLLRSFLQEEDGVQTLEIVLILAVLLGLALLFKDSITNMANQLFEDVFGDGVDASTDYEVPNG